MRTYPIFTFQGSIRIPSVVADRAELYTMMVLAHLTPVIFESSSLSHFLIPLYLHKHIKQNYIKAIQIVQ